MRTALEAARTFGFGRVERSVRHDNARALALYRKVGFEIEGRKRNAVLIDGVFHDLIIMGLLFDAVTKVPHSAGQAL
jgi:RimJ/RimL family protein N-acetyltransferase